MYIYLKLKKNSPINNTGTHVYAFFTYIIDGNKFFIKRKKNSHFYFEGCLNYKICPMMEVLGLFPVPPDELMIIVSLSPSVNPRNATVINSR